MLDPAVPPLASARLLLRRPQGSDAAPIQALADDWEVARWMGRLPHPYGHDDAAFFIATIVPAEPCWAIIDRAQDRFVGVIGLAPVAAPDAAEFGYWLGRPFWGQGFATEAGRMVLAHAFAASPLATVLSGYFAGNARSAHVLDKLGFVTRGPSRRMNIAQGKLVDHVDVELSGARWRRSPA